MAENQQKHSGDIGPENPMCLGRSADAHHGGNTSGIVSLESLCH